MHPAAKKLDWEFTCTLKESFVKVLNSFFIDLSMLYLQFSMLYLQFHDFFFLINFSNINFVKKSTVLNIFKKSPNLSPRRIMKLESSGLFYSNQYIPIYKRQYQNF